MSLKFLTTIRAKLNLFTHPMIKMTLTFPVSTSSPYYLHCLLPMSKIGLGAVMLYFLAYSKKKTRGCHILSAELEAKIRICRDKN